LEMDIIVRSENSHNLGEKQERRNRGRPSADRQGVGAQETISQARTP